MGLKILFKTKGGHKEGIGDVASSVSLAEEFRTRGQAVFFIINSNEKIVDLITERKFDYKIVKYTEELQEYLTEINFDVAILNQLNTPLEETLIFKNKSKFLVTIEDVGESAKLADLRFNILYPARDSVSDFVYIPLSKSFQVKHHLTKEIKDNVRSIIVMQGGSDTYGFTPKIIRALYNIHPDIVINVTVGPSFCHDDELHRVLLNSPRKFNIVRGLTDLSNLILEADLAISAGGNTLFELACLGVPAIVICGEDFEAITADRLQKEGFGINLGFGKKVREGQLFQATNRLINNKGLRLSMSQKGKQMIDGKGSERCVQMMLSRFCVEGGLKEQQY